MGQNYTARLENWAYNRKQNIIIGDVYDDKNGRFVDGSKIATSRLKPMSMQVSLPEEGAIMTTLNSTYLLGRKNNGN